MVEVVETPSFRERVFFVGANGSGKSVLIGRMAGPYESIVVIDIKHDFPVPVEWGDEYQIIGKPPAAGLLAWLAWNWGKRRIIYRPSRPYDTGKWIAGLLDWIFDRARAAKGKRPILVVVDEGAWLSYQGARDAIARLAITGRSLNIGFWLGSQRPRGIPVEVRSEAWRWYIFYLRSREDRKEIIGYLDHQITEYDLEGSTNDFEFLEVRRAEGGKMKARRLPPVRFGSPNVGG